MTVRVEFPRAGEPWPARVRVFTVAEDGTEAEITEITSVEITARPDDVIRARIETFMALPAHTNLTAAGEVIMVCPGCRREVACVE
jgi:hypothetical protein